MRLKLAFIIVLCMLVPIVAGCATSRAATTEEPTSGGNISSGLPLAPDFRIPDIPVPAGFEFDRVASFVFQNSVLDVGKIQYAGNSPINDVAQFYLDEMPRYHWKILSVAEHQTITMFFDKENKSCQVMLTPKTIRGTIIQISFYPKAAAPAERE